MSYESLYPNLDRFYRLMRYVLQEIMLDQGIWAGQDRVLCALSYDASTLQSELSRRLRMNEKGLHRSIQYLRKLGCVHVEELAGDRRANAIRLTSIGKLSVDHIHWTYGVVGNQVAAGLLKEELDELNRLLIAGLLREDALRQKGRFRELADPFRAGNI